MKRNKPVEKEITFDTEVGTYEKFIHMVKESTASSPSGRHYGHYKAIMEWDHEMIGVIHGIICLVVQYRIILKR